MNPTDLTDISLSSNNLKLVHYTKNRAKPPKYKRKLNLQTVNKNPLTIVEEHDTIIDDDKTTFSAAIFTKQFEPNFKSKNELSLKQIENLKDFHISDGDNEKEQNKVI